MNGNRKTVAIRVKKLKEKSRLYLDIYSEGQRKYRFLDIYLYKDDSEEVISKKKAEAVSIAKTYRSGILIPAVIKAEPAPLKPDSIGDTIERYITFKNRTANKGMAAAAKNCLTRLRKFDVDTKTADIDRKWVKSYYTFLTSQTDIRSATKKMYWVMLKCVVNEFYEDNELTNNPFIGYKAKWKKEEDTRVHYMTSEQLEAYENIDIDKIRVNQIETYRAFCFCCHTGLRYSDVTTLRYSDISYDTTNAVYLIRKKMIKTGKTILIPLNAGAMRYIKEKYIGKKDLVFGMTRCPASANNIIRNIAKKCKVELPYLHFHLARHTYATLLLKKTGNIMVVKQALGHADVSTTLRYAELLQDEFIKQCI